MRRQHPVPLHHELIAANEYWPDHPTRAAELAPSKLATARDLLLGMVVVSKLENAFSTLKHDGARPTLIPAGTALPMDADGGLIKIIEDSRHHLKGPANGYFFTGNNQFDEQAELLGRELLPQRDEVYTRVGEGMDRLAVGRRVLYLQGAPSKQQLAGLSGAILTGHGSNGSPLLYPAVTVGQTVKSENDIAQVERRVVAATHLRPPVKDGSRRRIFDLAPRLSAATGRI